MKRVSAIWICLILSFSIPVNGINSNDEHEQTETPVDLSITPLDITYADYPTENHSIKISVSVHGDPSLVSPWEKCGLALDVGGTGETVTVTAPYILKISNSSYIMWYSATGADGRSRIYRASSTDGINWTKDGLAVDIGGTYEDAHVGHPCVIIDSNGTYHMWYSGKRYSAPPQSPHWAICKATSIDGFTWIKDGYDIVGGHGGWGDGRGAIMPYVIYEDNEWKCWYTGYYNPGGPAGDPKFDEHMILYANKTQLSDAWTLHGVVLDNMGEYDWRKASAPCVLPTATGYEMYYAGYRSIDTTYRILHATSPNGIQWTRTGIVFEPTTPNEGTNVCYPCVINDNNVSRMWYGGGPDSGGYVRIYYAQNNNTFIPGKNATCDVILYCNEVNEDNIVNFFTGVNVEYGSCVTMDSYTVLPKGNHTIIVQITNVTPNDYIMGNNIASKEIIVYSYHADWPMLGRDIQHTCNNPFTEAPDECILDWTFNLNLESADGPWMWFGGSPVASYGNVYIQGGGDNKSLFCLNQVTGSMVWNYTFAMDFEGSTPAIKDGKVYIPNDGILHCFNAFNGSLEWTVDYGYSAFSSPVIDDDRIYYGWNDAVRCISLTNQSLIWERSASARFTTPSISGDNIYFTSATGYVYSVNKWNGSTNWFRYLDTYGGQSVLYSNGKLFVGAGCRAYCLDANNGNTIWYHNLPTYAATLPGINMDRVYFGAYYETSGVGRTYCFDSNTGEQIWYTNISSNSAPAIVDGKIYMGDGKFDTIICLDEYTGSILWTYNLMPKNVTVVSSQSSSPAVVDGRVFVGSYDGTFRCFVTNQSNPASTATATGPQGAHHEPVINLTYTWTGTPSAIDLYYTPNNGNTWHYIGTDTTVDGYFIWEPPEAWPGPKPKKFWWIANANGGADDVGIPADGTPPEAGPFNWKVFDVTLEDSSKGPGDIGWFFVSVPLDVNGNLTSIFDDDNWGDGGTTWDCIMWYDTSDYSDPWKTYNINKPESLNDHFNYTNNMGVWIHITSNDDDGFLTAGEGVNATSTSINLYAGWNMVGYPSMIHRTVVDALWGTTADEVMVCDPSEPYRIKEVGPDYIMTPGEAYWVHVVADSVWVVDW